MRSTYHELITPMQVEYDIDLLEDSSFLRYNYTGLELSPEPMDVIKIIFLGAQGVGKTSIIQQFVWNHFNEEYSPTRTKQCYYTSAMCNGQLYQLKITDMPPIAHFPADEFVEWTDFRFYGLRNANAYILVFDLADLETFQYVRLVRQQIAQSRDMRNIPMLVIGNKRDLIANIQRSHFNNLRNSHDNTGELQKEKLKEIVSLIRKQWKCLYIDCSAKYNWKVVTVFKELIKLTESIQPRTGTLGHREVTSVVIENMHGNMDSAKCIIL